MTYSTENLNELKRLLKRNCEKNKTASADLVYNSEISNSG